MSKLPSDWHGRMLKEYEEGGSDVEVCALLRITRNEFDTLFNTDNDFQDTVSFGRMLCMAWWYAQCRKGLRDKTFNTALFYATMKNRFGWSDKVENANKETKDVADMSEDEIQTELLARAKQYAKVAKKGGLNIDEKDFLSAKH